MAIGLHPECTRKLLEKTSEYLSFFQVDNGIMPNYKSAMPLLLLEKILPERGPVRDLLNQYVGEGIPFFTFILEHIFRDLVENGTYDPDAKGVLLSKFPKYSDLKNFSKQIIQDFESLPWTYLISLELPVEIGSKLRESFIQYELTSKFKVVSPDESFNTTYPLKSGIKNRDQNLFWAGWGSLLGTEQRWNPEAAYLQIEVQGFIGQIWETLPLIEIISTVKAFLGLSLALRFLKIREDPRAVALGIPKIHLSGETS